MGKFYYATCGTNEKFLKGQTQYAIKSLLQTGVDPEDVYCMVRKKSEAKLMKKLVPELVNIHPIDIKIDHCVWKYCNGIRKFALFKAGAMSTMFSEPKPDRCLIHFDGDVLWYKNPEPFLESKSEKTWYHHGKDLSKRSKLKAKQVDITDYKSLSKWVSAPCAYLMVAHGAKRLPEREVVSGFYLLHPRDQILLPTTYQYANENSRKFAHHEGGGEQKPMNAALSVLEIDWHGGSRFFCPEHLEYFDHFFGSKVLKRKMRGQLREMKL